MDTNASAGHKTERSAEGEEHEPPPLHALRGTGTMVGRWLGVVVGLVALAAASCGAGDSTSTAETPIEEKLAAVAGDGTSDEAVRPYQLGLNAAEPVCTEDREHIADIVYAGQQAAEDAGVDTTALEPLRAIPSAVPEGMRPTSCADVVGTLIVMKRP